MQAFCIKDCALVAMATGVSVQTLKELKEAIIKIPLDSIYHHFWGNRLKAQFVHPEYHNDFGWWAFNSLQDQTLAERLSVIDPVEFSSLEQLKEKLVEIMEERMEENPLLQYFQAQFPFYFMYAKTIVFETNSFLESPDSLLKLMPTLSSGSIFYHFIEARRRTVSSMDDFSNWLKEFNTEESRRLIRELQNIDIYFLTLPQLKEEIYKIIMKIWNKR